MIAVENLTKKFGNKTAVNNISFEVKKGEVLGFLGPNGAGKSTTMRILTGFLPPTAGKVFLGGVDVLKKPVEARMKLGYLPESVPIYQDMTVKEFLDFSASLKGLSGSPKKKRVDTVMAQTSVTQYAKALIRTLSKGYRQRVGLAQALVSNPEVLILDEPTIGLDPKQIIEIRELIKNLGGDHTVILGTHILPEVSMTCERVIIISDGNIVASDTPQNLTKKLQKFDQIQLQVQGNPRAVLATLNRIRGVKGVTAKERDIYHLDMDKNMDPRSVIAEKIVNKGFKLLEMRPVSMTLEDIFIKLVTKEEDRPREGINEIAHAQQVACHL